MGDARTVLSRNGVAVRLSYDHKGSDPAESLRVRETGGFMMNHRVNGIQGTDKRCTGGYEIVGGLFNEGMGYRGSIYN